MLLEEARAAFRARLRKRALWGVFLLVGAAYGVYPVLHWLRDRPHPPLPQLLVQFPSALLFYFAFIWFSPVPWQWDGRPGAAPAPGPRILQAFLAAEGLITLTVLVDDLLGRWTGRGPLPWDVYLANLCFQGPALFLVGHLMANQERLQWERQALQEKTQEARAQHLKGQIHPHVIFNALNGLAELVVDDPLEAEACVQAMARFLRRILDASEQGLWNLGEERALVGDFLRMEAMRLGDRLRVRWRWPKELDGRPVLPLVVQPLVENALKHGIGPLEEGGDLELEARRVGPGLILEVRNTGCPPVMGERCGVGLRNLRARLELAYGDLGTLDLVREGDWTIARIRLNLESRESAHDSPSNAGR